MKKVLIGTSALVAAGFIAAAPATAAEKIKLGLGGFQNTWVGFASQDGGYEGTNDYGSFDVKSNSEIHFKGSSKLDNGLTVGAHVELESDRDSGGAIDHSYAYISSADMGTLYLGGTAGAFDRLSVNAPTAAFTGETTGGQEGPRQWIASPFAVDGSGTAVGAEMINFIHADAGDTNRITYISPSFSGFQVGASYVPSTQANQNANATKDGANNATSDEYQWHASAKYSGNFDGVGLNLSAGYLRQDDDETAANTDGYKRWRANGTVSYAGFTFGGGYTSIDIDNSTESGLDGNGWNVGLMYATGPYKISGNYFKSSVKGSADATDPDDDVYTYYGLNGSYNMGPGVDLKASISKVKYEDETTVATNSNDGWFAAAGLNLSF